jgi:hypothetical protein
LGGFDVHDDPPNGHVPTNPLERFNREIARRTDVVGIFPDDAPLIRLASILAIEQDDEWLVGRRYLSASRVRSGSDASASKGSHLPSVLFATFDMA